MTYWGSDKSNWGHDRKKRLKVFDVLKGYQSARKVQKTNSHSSIEKPKKRFDWIVPLLGAILKIIVFLVIFYAFAMLISHGKRWPE